MQHFSGAIFQVAAGVKRNRRNKPVLDVLAAGGRYDALVSIIAPTLESLRSACESHRFGRATPVHPVHEQCKSSCGIQAHLRAIRNPVSNVTVQPTVPTDRKKRLKPDVATCALTWGGANCAKSLQGKHMVVLRYRQPGPESPSHFVPPMDFVPPVDFVPPPSRLLPPPGLCPPHGHCFTPHAWSEGTPNGSWFCN